MNNVKMSWLEEKCPITLSTFKEIGQENVFILPCLHKFEKKAIVTHIEKGNESCPVCKNKFKASDLGITTLRETQQQIREPLLYTIVYATEVVDSEDSNASSTHSSSQSEEEEEYSQENNNVLILLTSDEDDHSQGNSEELSLLGFIVADEDSILSDEDYEPSE